MALILEDGTGEVTGANSYASVAEAKAYWDNGGFVYTDVYSDPQIEVALILATRYIELKFRNKFRGYRLLSTQPLSFPRQYLYIQLAGNCYSVEEIPDQLKSATIEYAQRALENPDGLAPDPGGYDATGQLITEKMTKVGPIEKSVKYESGSGAITRSYPAADELLTEYLYATDGVIRN